MTTKIATTMPMINAELLIRGTSRQLTRLPLISNPHILVAPRHQECRRSLLMEMEWISDCKDKLYKPLPGGALRAISGLAK
jgi:hypothetical protein